MTTTATRRRYAADTEVSVARSREEIERTLARYGGTGFGYLTDDTIPAALIVFRLRERYYRLYVPLPKRTDDAIRFTPARRELRTAEAQAKTYAQIERQRWRAVALYIKAVLEAAESGIVSVEQALLAHAILPNNTTVGEWAGEQLAEVYRTGQMPQLLPGMPPQLGPGPAAPE
jgi:hypothetical protein